MIRRLDNYDGASINFGKCFVFNLPKTKEEDFVFRLGLVEGERGYLDIGQRAVVEMAMMLGWMSPQERDRLTDEFAADLLEQLGEIDTLQEEIESIEAAGVTVRSLARELDLAEAKADDAITQFHAAEERIKELEVMITELSDDQ